MERCRTASVTLRAGKLPLGRNHQATPVSAPEPARILSRIHYRFLALHSVFDLFLQTIDIGDKRGTDDRLLYKELFAGALAWISDSPDSERRKFLTSKPLVFQ